MHLILKITNIMCQFNKNMYCYLIVLVNNFHINLYICVYIYILRLKWSRI